jgi:hypothetical protein
MVMACSIKDFEEAKKRIKKFRRELTAYLQRDGIEPDAVYALQVSFFPLEQSEKENENEN